MQAVPKPTTRAGDLNRITECEFALEPAFNEIVAAQPERSWSDNDPEFQEIRRSAANSNWSPGEVTAALRALIEQHRFKEAWDF